MPKTKSSASSATKKKHARRAAAKDEKDKLWAAAEEETIPEDLTEDQGAGDNAVTEEQRARIPSAETSQSLPSATGESVKQKTKQTEHKSPSKPMTEPQKLQRGQKKQKQSKKHRKGEAPPPPRRKQYIPPPKPPKGQLDPVDIYGLGVTGGFERVPAAKVVTLRLLNKKDENSIERAVEDLITWVKSTGSKDPAETVQHILEAIPVWVHHIPRLLSHSSRKVRLQAATLNALLLHTGPSALLEETMPTLVALISPEHPNFLPSMLSSAFDSDRQVRTSASATWQALLQHMNLEDSLEALFDALTSAILEEAEFGRRASDSQNEQDDGSAREESERIANHLSANIDAYTYLLGQCRTALEDYCEPILSSASFWTLLHLSEWPLVRRAVWRLLAKVLSMTALNSLMKQNTRMVCMPALHALRLERDFTTQNTMWPAVVSLFESNPKAWYTSPQVRSHLAASSDSDDSSSQGSSSDVEGTQTLRQQSVLADNVQSYLDLLQLGFYGNAASGYSYMPAVLRTIPESYLTSSDQSVQLFYNSFWAAYSGRALYSSGPTGVTAFASACVDSIDIFLSTQDNGPGQNITLHQLALLWQYYMGALAAPSRVTSLSRLDCLPIVKEGLEQAAKYASSLFKDFSELLHRSAMLAIEQGTTSPSLFAETIASLCKSSSPAVAYLGLAMEHSAVEAAVVAEPGSAKGNLLSALLAARATALFDSASSRDTLDRYILTVGLSQHPSMEGYLRYRKDTTAINKAWQHMVAVMSEAVEQADLDVLLPVTESIVSKRLDTIQLPPAGLDALLLSRVEALIDGSASIGSNVLQTLQNLIISPSPLVHGSWAVTVICIAEAGARRSVDRLCETASDSEGQDVNRLLQSLRILQLFSTPQLYNAAVEVPLFITVFEAAFLLPQKRAERDDTTSVASDLWQTMINQSASLGPDIIALAVAARLGAYVRESTIDCFHLVACLAELEGLPGVTTSHLWDAFLPERPDLDNCLNEVFQIPTHRALYITKNLVNPCPSGEEGRSREKYTASYVRSTTAWTILLSRDRAWASQHIWFLPHAILLRELLDDDAALQPPTYLPPSEQAALQVICRRLSAYLVLQGSTNCDNAWHDATISACRSAAEPILDQLSGTFVLAIHHLEAAQTSSSLAGRTFVELMTLLLRYSDMQVEDAERWLTFAKSIQTTNPAGCLAIVWATKPLLLDSQHFHRYQSQVASSLSHIRPEHAAGQGIILLRLLATIASTGDSDLDFLPVNRAVFLLQALQRWLVEDDTSVDEDHYAPLIDVFTTLVPTLQNTLSTMWFTMFDVVESSIELADWQDLDTLPALWAACRFIREVKLYCAANKALREHLSSKFAQLVGQLEDQFASLAHAKLTIPTNAVMELISEIVFEDSSLNPSSLPKLYPLLAHPDIKIQITTYIAARRLVATLTEERSLSLATAAEALDTHPSPIDQSLLNMHSEDSMDAADSERDVAKLLGWLLVFRHFDSASVALKTAFTEQLRSSGVITTVFMPAVLRMLGIGEITGPIDLYQWSVDEFDFEAAREAPTTALNTTALASYAYYQSLRAIPALIRQTWEGYRSKQLSGSVAQLTARYFSPLLIAAELSVLDSEADNAAQNEEQMTTKVLRSINEVKATYNVDEQPLELSIRLPSDFPLSLVEVREGRRIGVPEAIWRAWIMNVQLIINSQNGTIADALQLFKTNATRHFEGVEACAICYSVIAAADRSLPTKHCRTCKNAFHPPCLWKWFQTSHSSSCPLCRALF